MIQNTRKLFALAHYGIAYDCKSSKKWAIKMDNYGLFFSRIIYDSGWFLVHCLFFYLRNCRRQMLNQMHACHKYLNLDRSFEVSHVHFAKKNPSGGIL